MRWLKITYLACLFFLFGSGLQAINKAGVIGIAAGFNHSLFCQNDGTVFACGTNQHGQLGTAGIPASQSLTPLQTVTYIESNSSLPTTAFSQVTAVAAGASHCISLKNDGSVYTWGENNDGQLGINNTTRSNVPVQVIQSTGQPLENIQAIAAGTYFSLALGSDGVAWSWGQDQSGQLGRAIINPNNLVAGQVDTSTGLPPIVAIAAGAMHALALDSEGRVWAWGDNTHGQLGNGSTLPSSSPVQVKFKRGFRGRIKGIAAGGYHSLALADDGSVLAWGWNAYGQLGIDKTSMQESLTAVTVQNLPAYPLVTAVVTGCSSMTSYALMDDGRLFAWGDNTSGQLGDGTTTGRDTPKPVLSTQGLPLSGVIAVAGGTDYFLTILSDGTVMSCGANSVGQLGIGTTQKIFFPQTITFFPPTEAGVKAIAGGSNFNLAIKTNGEVWGWGNNSRGQIQTQGQDSNFPVHTQLPTQMIAIAAGGLHSLAITRDRTIFAWGANNKGQLGNGTTDVSPPGEVLQNFYEDLFPLDSVIAIAAGDAHSLALTSQGWVFAWGANDKAQIGQNSLDPQYVYTTDAMQRETIAIAAGANSSYALNSDGTVNAWGDNTYGQAGYCPSASNPVIPYSLPIKGLSGVKSIAAGANHALALTDNGTVFAWGSNAQSQLGNGESQGSQCTPVPVMQSATDRLTHVVAIAAAGNHSLAVKADGTVWAWGSNSDGELGDGTMKNAPFPVQVQRAPKDGLENPLTGITAITGGKNDSCAFGGGNGMVWGFGMNSSGQLGNGTFENSSFAVANVFTPTASFIVNPKDQTVISGQNVTLTLTSNTDATFDASSQTNTYVISKNVSGTNPIIQTLTYDPPLPTPKVLPKGIAHYTIIPHASATSYSFHGPQVWVNIQVPPPTSILQE